MALIKNALLSKKAKANVLGANHGTLFNPKGGRPDTSNAAVIRAAKKADQASGAKKPAAAKKPNANSYALQDPDYKSALAGYTTNLTSTKNQAAQNKSDLTADFNTTNARLQDQFKTNNYNQDSDFANRGMFGSGAYAKVHSDATKDQTNQLNDAQDSYTRNSRQIDTDVTNATNLEKQQVQTAKAAAIARAAAKYGITGTASKKTKAAKTAAAVKAAAKKKKK
jgi:hypothetical protein